MKPYACLFILLLISSLRAEPKPVPKVQALPLPNHEITFEQDGDELARFYYGSAQRRPFVYPLNGPSGRPLTRMGHPRDPEGHSHHNSVWISHEKVGGVNFWGDRGGKIVHARLLRIEDGDELAYIESENTWTSPEGAPVLQDRRRVAVQTIGNKEWLLLLDLELHAKSAPVELAESPFGLLGVRMAKTIGVHDGGGTIRNSEGGVNEAGCFRKRARWIDYSGPITANATEGIALFDHPQNVNHPVAFHCRDDGWMGASLTLPGAIQVKPGEPLRLKYALYVHSGQPEPAIIDEQWKKFAESGWREIGEKPAKP
jgi:hypothetical protein